MLMLHAIKKTVSIKSTISSINLSGYPKLRIESRHLARIVHAKRRTERRIKKGNKSLRREEGQGEWKEEKRGILAGRLGGGKFNFDPVDSAVIPKFNL